jgi:hypothetical protein
VAVTQLLLLTLLFPGRFVDGGVNVRLLSLREIERAVTTFLNFSALTMKDDDEKDEDEKRGEGRESDENIVVVVFVVVVEQANMSFFLQPLVSYYIFFFFLYSRVSVRFCCVACT